MHSLLKACNLRVENGMFEVLTSVYFNNKSHCKFVFIQVNIAETDENDTIFEFWMCFLFWIIL